MKWLRIIFAAFLLVGMLLGVSSVAYADDPPDGDPGLNVDIVVVGDNPEVNMDVLGNNSEVTVNTSGTEVWINGQNLNEPTAVYNTTRTGASNMGVRRIVKYVMFPYMEETWARLNLTADGLAKVIKLAQSSESDIANINSQISNSISDRLNDQGERLTALELEAASQAGQIETLKAQDAAIQAQITAKVNYVIDSYNRILAIVIGAFSLVVIGLGVGLYLTRRRTL